VQDGWQRKHSIDFDGIQEAPTLRPTSGNSAILTSQSLETLSESIWRSCVFATRNLESPPHRQASDYEFKGAKSDLVLDMCVQLKAEPTSSARRPRYADVESFAPAEWSPISGLPASAIPAVARRVQAYMSIVDLLLTKVPAAGRSSCRETIRTTT